jgi:hypothetical protein
MLGTFKNKLLIQVFLTISILQDWIKTRPSIKGFNSAIGINIHTLLFYKIIINYCKNGLNTHP